MISGAYDTIIVDDQEIDRLTTALYVRAYPFLNITGIYESATEALRQIDVKPPAVLLLDIDMPGLSGIDLRKQAMDSACIFITAFPDYAVDAFDMAALDFIIKPIEHNRFAAAMGRLQEYLTVRHKAALLDLTLSGDTIFVKDGHNNLKVHLHDVLYLEALKDYTMIVTRNKRHCVLSLLGSLLEEKAFGGFTRIHRSYAVQPHFIEKISFSEVQIDDISLPVGRTYRPALLNILQQNNHPNVNRL